MNFNEFLWRKPGNPMPEYHHIISLAVCGIILIGCNHEFGIVG